MTRLRMITIAALLAAPSLAAAQPLGTFRWQLQPFCNVVTLAVTQNGGVYRLEGTDGQCGNGADQASAIGMAFLNPDGAVGLGFHIVTPGGQPVHVEARLTLPSLNGTWRDSAGHAGDFLYTHGAGTGGSARPLPAPASGDVTGIIAGAGLTGGGAAGDVTVAIDHAAVQRRVSGACASGQAVRSINENGTVACETISSPGVPPAIQLRADGALVATGSLSQPSPIPASGPGTRLMWYPFQAAFRAGHVDNGSWDDTNVGQMSVALGYNTVASGGAGTALGHSTTASGLGATAMGRWTVASGPVSFAMGDSGRATGLGSTVMGVSGLASGHSATAMGANGRATGDASTAMGSDTQATGVASTAMGQASQASGLFSTAMGDHTVASGQASLAAGRNLSAAGAGSVALGARVAASTAGTFMFGDTSTTTDMTTALPNQFLVRAAGGTGFYSNAALTTGVELLPGASAWSSASDSRKKTAFRELSHDEVLDKIAQMAVTEWSYVAQDPSIRHVGPTAQDFHAAFGLGEDPLRISTLDADGVALAAVRALEARTRELLRMNDALERRLAALEALLGTGHLGQEKETTKVAK